MNAPLTIVETAISLREEGRFQAAADLLAAAFRNQPHDGEICLQLGLVLHAAGDREAAIEYLRRGHQCAPSDALISSELALLLRESGETEASEQALLESIEARSMSARVAGLRFDSPSETAA